jgi:hypothetical protein
MENAALVWTVNALIVLVLMEAIVLFRRHRGGGLPRFLPTLLAGLGLLVALRLVLADAPGFWIHLCIAASGVAHAIDLIRMWRR